jgi:iron complex outermembrane recepter protein
MPILLCPTAAVSRAIKRRIVFVRRINPNRHWLLFVAGVALMSTAWSANAKGQVVRYVSEESYFVQQPAPTMPEDPETTGENIDQLLELAEQNVDELSRVRVTSPALDLVVTTVSRQKSTVGRTPAAVFVITNEMIRRSGATSIPEVLRMAPDVQVARLDSNKWAISIRGFNGRFANKLLVQIDGRSVYTPLFAGVFWDVQDVVLEDIERIEVIRGPGATVWGANAVNGVINIITKRASETQGYYAQVIAGKEDRAVTTARVGGQISENAHYRVYGKWFERDEGFAPNDAAHDDWRIGRGGFRIDWEPSCCDLITYQGDYYDGYAGQRSLLSNPTSPPDFFRISDTDFHVAGGNVLWRWTHQLSDDSDWSAQAYYDRTERALVNEQFREDRDTIDFDFQHRFPLADNHSFIWGFGYRYTEDFIVNQAPTLIFTPTRRTDDLFSYFVQDEITLIDELLVATLGSKFQHNDYTGFEAQPTARLLWTPSERHSIWGAVSRAVRTPSRAEDDVQITLLPSVVPGLPPPTFSQILGTRGITSEVLWAYECGVRVQATEQFSWDLALFFHDYEDLSSTTPGTPYGPAFPPFGPTFLPLSLGNASAGETYGFELGAAYDPTPTLHIFGTYSLLIMDLGGSSTEGQSPRNQAYVQASWDVGPRTEFDLIGRYVDRLPSLGVPSYTTMDARLAYWVTPNLEAAVVGRQLLDSSHSEFGFDTFTGNVNTEVQRDVYASLIWRR